MTLTPESIELAIGRLESMCIERERLRTSGSADHKRLLIASCEWAALLAGIDALKAQLKGVAS